MEKASLLKRVVSDPMVCSGKPCIRGTRIWVSLILDNLADGASQDEILAAYPALSQEDIQAAMVYAAEIARDRYVSLATG